MLVLSRKVGESIRISDNITVKVIEIRGNRLRLGIEAPENIAILRGELDPTGGGVGEKPANREVVEFELAGWIDQVKSRQLAGA